MGKTTKETKNQQHSTKQFVDVLKVDNLMEIIEREQCRTIEELILELPCSKPTFYEYIKVDTDDFNAIKGAIDMVKVKKKKAMRNIWEVSDNATLQLAAFKLNATPEELEALSMTKNINENTHKLPELPDWMK